MITTNDTSTLIVTAKTAVERGLEVSIKKILKYIYIQILIMYTWFRSYY